MGSMLIASLMHALFMWHMVNHVVAIPRLRYTTPIFNVSMRALQIGARLYSIVCK